MPENVDKDIFDVVAASIWGSLAFLYAWVIRNTFKINKTTEDLIKNDAMDIGLQESVREIKESIHDMKQSIDQMKLVVADQKEMFNAVVIKNQELETIIKEFKQLLE